MKKRVRFIPRPVEFDVAVGHSDENGGEFDGLFECTAIVAREEMAERLMEADIDKLLIVEVISGIGREDDAPENEAAFERLHFGDAAAPFDLDDLVTKCVVFEAMEAKAIEHIVLVKQHMVFYDKASGKGRRS